MLKRGRRNEVYGIRNQRPKKNLDQGSQLQDLESQCVGSGSAVFFMESGIRLTTKTGSGIKILIVFGIRDQLFGYKYEISNEKIHLVTTLRLALLSYLLTLSKRYKIMKAQVIDTVTYIKYLFYSNMQSNCKKCNNPFTTYLIGMEVQEASVKRHGLLL